LMEEEEGSYAPQIGAKGNAANADVLFLEP
jgi:hypothetical protein